MKVRSIAVAAAAATLLASCGGGGPTLRPRDLERVMPSAADAPPGTTIDAERAGLKTIDEFLTEPQVKIRLSALGFKAAYEASFATRNYVGLPGTPIGSAFYATFAVLVEDEAAAEQGFDFYVDRLRERAKGFTPFVTDDPLGDQTLAFRFSALDDVPQPGMAIMWRYGNALFSALGVGNPSPDPQTVRAIAATIDRRAKRD